MNRKESMAPLLAIFSCTAVVLCALWSRMRRKWELKHRSEIPWQGLRLGGSLQDSVSIEDQDRAEHSSKQVYLFLIFLYFYISTKRTRLHVALILGDKLRTSSIFLDNEL